MPNPWNEQSTETQSQAVPNPFANRTFIEQAQLQDEPGIFSPDDLPDRINLVSQNNAITINEVSGMTFLKNDDTPSSYAGKSDYFLKVNSAATGIEFVDIKPWVIKHLYWKQFGSSVYYTTGNVGIGLHNPAYTLDVTGDINFTGDVYFASSKFIRDIGDYDLFIGLNTIGDGNYVAGDNFNTGVGAYSLYSLTTGQSNTAVGADAGDAITTGDENSFFGSDAGGGITAASSRNTLIGSCCMGNGANYPLTDVVGVGASIGANAARTVTEATIIGSEAAYNLFTASGFVSVGYRSGYNLSTGGGHVFLGWKAGDTITTGTNGILIGYDADTDGVDYTNFIGIGYQAAVTASNQVVIGNTSISTMKLPWMTTAGWLMNDVNGNVTGGNSVSAIDHGGLGGLTDNDHTQYILHSLADAENDFLVASGDDAFVRKTLAETGAILEADINHDNLVGFVANEHLPGIDEDNMISDSAAHVPTQQSVKKYVDDNIGGGGGGFVWYPDTFDGSEDSDRSDHFDDDSFDIAKWTKFQDTNLTWTEEKARLELKNTGDAAVTQRGFFHTVDSGSFTITAKIGVGSIGEIAAGDFTRAGIAVFEDATNNPNTCDLVVSQLTAMPAGTVWLLHTLLFTDYDTQSTTIEAANKYYLINVMYLRCTWDETNLKFYVSTDGITWLQLCQYNPSFTPAEFGICVGTRDSVFVGVSNIYWITYHDSDLAGAPCGSA